MKKLEELLSQLVHAGIKIGHDWGTSDPTYIQQGRERLLHTAKHAARDVVRQVISGQKVDPQAVMQNATYQVYGHPYGYRSSGVPSEYYDYMDYEDPHHHYGAGVHMGNPLISFLGSMSDKKKAADVALGHADLPPQDRQRIIQGINNFYTSLTKNPSPNTKVNAAIEDLMATLHKHGSVSHETLPIGLARLPTSDLLRFFSTLGMLAGH